MESLFIFLAGFLLGYLTHRDDQRASRPSISTTEWRERMRRLQLGLK